MLLFSTAVKDSLTLDMITDINAHGCHCHVNDHIEADISALITAG